LLVPAVNEEEYLFSVGREDFAPSEMLLGIKDQLLVMKGLTR